MSKRNDLFSGDVALLTLTIHHLQRMRNSSDGNPRWTIGGRTDSGMSAVVTTAKDSTVGYAVSTAWEGRRFRFTLNTAGHVIDAEEIGSAEPALQLKGILINDRVVYMNRIQLAAEIESLNEQLREF